MEDVPASQGGEGHGLPTSEQRPKEQVGEGGVSLPPHLRAVPAFHEQAPGGMADVLSVVLRRLYPNDRERVSVAYSLLHACARLYAQARPAVRRRGQTLLSLTRRRRGASLRALPHYPRGATAGPASLPASPLAPPPGRLASATAASMTALRPHQRRDSVQSSAPRDGTPQEPQPRRGALHSRAGAAQEQALGSAAAGSAELGGAYARAYGEGMYAGRPSRSLLPTPPPRDAASPEGGGGAQQGPTGSRVYRRARAKLRRGLRRVRILRFAAGAFSSATGLQAGTRGLGFRVTAQARRGGGGEAADAPSWLGARGSGAAPPGRRSGAGAGDSATTGEAGLQEAATRIAKDLLRDIASEGSGGDAGSAGAGDQGTKPTAGRSRHLRAALRTSVLLALGSQREQEYTFPPGSGGDGCDDPLWADSQSGFLTCFTATLFGDLAPEALLDVQDMTSVVQRSVAWLGVQQPRTRFYPLSRGPLTPIVRPPVPPSNRGGLGAGSARHSQLPHGHARVPVPVQAPRPTVATLPGGAV